ncbi:MAG: hypothetical protein LBN29_12960 [Mediterranea sp.]|jgi:mRNA-degrading endonuclease RelE of RelBE toxin-antitoxin system|nr:hypothetical protein [Mediterranea sp.]
MKVEFSKGFLKSARKLTGKYRQSLQKIVQEVIEAKSINEISDCKKLIEYKYIYRIRMGNLRAFFTFHAQIIDDVVFFEYLLPRGEAYNKKNMNKLHDKDKG